MEMTTPASIQLRRIIPDDNPVIARIIRQVSAEYGLTADKGYTVADPNLDELYQVYSQPKHAFWVVELAGEVVGGGGIAPLTGGKQHLCELQKMYFLPAARGKGLAKHLALQAMAFACEEGFTHCYLETTAFLKDAIALYEHLGFKHILQPLGSTGHVDCEVRMLRAL